MNGTKGHTGANLTAETVTSAPTGSVSLELKACVDGQILRGQRVSLRDNIFLEVALLR